MQGEGEGDRPCKAGLGCEGVGEKRWGDGSKEGRGCPVLVLLHNLAPLPPPPPLLGPPQVCLLNYRRDGSPFWNQFSMHPIRNAAGRVAHYLGIQVRLCAV